MASATISMIANGQVPPPNDTLSISGSLPGGITASAYNPATGVLTLTGVASIADYQTALHQVVFSTTDTSNADRIISVTVNDGANTSNTAQTFMHVSSADLTSRCNGGHCRQFAHRAQRVLIGDNSFQRGRDWIRRLLTSRQLVERWILCLSSRSTPTPTE